MKTKYRKIWKYCGLMDGEHQWLRSHLKFLRGGDIFKIEGDKQPLMATSDSFVGGKGLTSINFVESDYPKGE